MIAGNFKSALDRAFVDAQSRGHKFVDINSGNLHREVGGYPRASHRMPVCCDVMRATMKPGDRVLEEPPGGRGASLTIRYVLPR